MEMSSNDAQINVSDVKAVIPPDGISMTGTESTTCSKFATFVVIIALIISGIAVIIAAVSLAQGGGNPTLIVDGISMPMSGDDSDSSAELTSIPAGAEGEIWTFAIGHDGTNVEYIDDVSGTLRGFHVDLVDAVCAAANRDCRLIWDIYENCWDSQAGQRPRGGMGLMGKWYDACTGWFNTYDRALTVQFSYEFRQGLNGTFFVRQGNPAGFVSTNIASNQKIGFIDGWAADEHCLARTPTITGVPLSDDQTVHFATREELQSAIENSEVAAGFANTNVFADGVLDTVGEGVSTCSLGGGSMMSRKDSALNVWFNPAFETIKSDGTYQTVCDKAATDHGHQPGATGDLLCVS